jgi:hypothetical protein
MWEKYAAVLKRSIKHYGTIVVPNKNGIIPSN